MSEPLYTPRQVRDDEIPTAAPPRPGTSALVLAAVAGLAAAIAGGVLWGLVVKWSDYEVGILAWGIGFVAGSAVLLATGGRRGPQFQAIAIVSALAGILLGKYLSFALSVQQDADELGLDIGLFSGEMRDLFRENLSDVFGVFDLLWIAFAVFTAWRIPRAEAEPPPVQQPSAPE